MCECYLRILVQVRLPLSHSSTLSECVCVCGVGVGERTTVWQACATIKCCPPWVGSVCCSFAALLLLLLLVTSTRRHFEPLLGVPCATPPVLLLLLLLLVTPALLFFCSLPATAFAFDAGFDFHCCSHKIFSTNCTHTNTRTHTHTAAHCSVQQQQEQQQQLRCSTRDKLALCFALRFRFRFALRSALRPVTLRFALRCVAAVSLSRRPPTCRVSAQLNIRTELCLACTRRKLSRLSLVRVPARERERARAQPIECVRALEWFAVATQAGSGRRRRRLFVY